MYTLQDEMFAWLKFIILTVLTLAGFTAIILLFTTIFTTTSDLKARCESMGAKTGITKCYKEGKEI